MIVYGRNPVREAFRGRRRVRRVWATPRLAAESWVRHAPVQSLSDAELTELCGSPDHQGVCAEADPYPYLAPDALIGGSPDALVICLDQIQDPRNLGAICRIAECAGATGVVIPERRSAEVTPVVCKTSAGAVEHLALARVRNVADFLEEAKEQGAWVYGAAADGKPYASFDYAGPVVLVLGSEGRGLRPRVAGACDALVSLPVRGQIASLNVSAAASALVYGILQSRESG